MRKDKPPESVKDLLERLDTDPLNETEAIKLIESHISNSNKRQRELCAKQVSKGIISVTFNLPDKIRNAPEPK